MSSHSMKAKRRHPDAPKEYYQVGHVTFEIIDHPENGATFALIAGEAVHAKDRRPLFSAHIKPGMHEQLRQLAFRLREIEMNLTSSPCETEVRKGEEGEENSA